MLEQLHDFVQPAIFEDIAREAIELCRTSLCSASELLKQRTQEKRKDSQVEKEDAHAGNEISPDAADADLFLIRHLLVLKQMVNDVHLGDDTGIDDIAIGSTGTISLGAFPVCVSIGTVINVTFITI